MLKFTENAPLRSKTANPFRHGALGCGFVSTMDSNQMAQSLIGNKFELRTQDHTGLSERTLADITREGRMGFLHSEETGSAVDGPGMRVVFWTTGCDFRCLYCHNPDTWKLKNGQLVSIDDITAEIEKYKNFLRLAGGGITVSGGEPLVQHKFVMNILRAAKERGVHTALDTNGFFGHRLSNDDLEQIDLVLLDLKSFDPKTHLHVTAQPVEPVLTFARRLAKMKKPIWVRFVLVPGLTDAPDNIEGVARFATSLGNVERVDVLPFHQLGRFKWHKLGMAYELEDTQSPVPEAVAAARRIFRTWGLHCLG